MKRLSEEISESVMVQLMLKQVITLESSTWPSSENLKNDVPFYYREIRDEDFFRLGIYLGGHKNTFPVAGKLTIVDSAAQTFMTVRYLLNIIRYWEYERNKGTALGRKVWKI